MPIVQSAPPTGTTPTLKGTANSNEPKAQKSGGAASVGDTAFKDALIVVVGAWAILIFLSWSLRSSNV